MTKSHKLVNTPTAARNAEWLASFNSSCSAKTPLLAAVLVFQLGNFGRDAFQLDIELRQSP
jgi:hypothetical protein